jgi:hypothetical protein
MLVKERARETERGKERRVSTETEKGNGGGREKQIASEREKKREGKK